MAKHRKPDTGGNTPPELRRRIDKAVAEKRFQTALELAKQLHRNEPIPENEELLFRVHLGRAAQLREQGAARDAVTVLANAKALANNDASRLLQIAEELVVSGELKQALAILDPLPEPKPTAKLWAKGADAALRRGAQGRSQLPENMHADFDRIRTAFAHLADGKDDQVKEVLQAVGLTSPFLEWKVLLRGFLAYYQNDDARALENWSRLDPTRFPARLAAPFRFKIDEGFQTAQAPETQLALRQQGDRLQSDAILGGLRSIQNHFIKHEGLRAAFREAELLMPTLRQQSPQLIPKLATCFYWEIIDQGAPEDQGRYKNVFGKREDDGHFNRLVALVTETLPDYAEANRAWNEYQKEIAENKTLWPGPENDRARAMVWFRMGFNGQKQDDVVGAVERIPANPFLGPRNRPARLNPSAEKCLEQAAQLAPDWVDPGVAVFELHRRRDNPKKAIESGHALLKRFPDHQPTLEAMAGLLRSHGDYADATAMLERAISGNPLHRGLRLQLGDTRRLMAARLTEEGKFAAARETFESAAALLDSRDLFLVHCQWAACEFKADNAARAEELVQKAMGHPSDGVATPLVLMAHAVAWKLHKTIKSRFEKEFKAQLDSPFTPEIATALCVQFARFQADNFVYHGGKTHQKKVIQQTEKTATAKYTEAQIIRLGTALLVLGAQNAIRRFTAMWRREFPKNPYPLFFEMESYLKGNEERWPLWRLNPLAQQAKQLAEKLPPDEKRDELLRAIEARMQQFRDLNPFASMFDSFMDNFGGDEFDDGEDGEW